MSRLSHSLLSLSLFSNQAHRQRGRRSIWQRRLTVSLYSTKSSTPPPCLLSIIDRSSKTLMVEGTRSVKSIIRHTMPRTCETGEEEVRRNTTSYRVRCRVEREKHSLCEWRTCTVRNAPAGFLTMICSVGTGLGPSRMWPTKGPFGFFSPPPFFAPPPFLPPPFFLAMAQPERAVQRERSSGWREMKRPEEGRWRLGTNGAPGMEVRDQVQCLPVCFALYVCIAGRHALRSCRPRNGRYPQLT